MRIWVALIVAGFIVATHAERQEIKADMQAETGCFEDALTRADVDHCYAFMRSNIERRNKD